MGVYTITLAILALALLVPLPAYLAYCHLNKKEIDNKLVQIIGFSMVVPAITLLTWDELISPEVAVAAFAAAAGFYLGKYATKKD